MVKFIPRIVKNCEQEKIGMNHSETSPRAVKISSDTWDYRYERIRSDEGYASGRSVLKCLDIATWLKTTNATEDKVAVIMEGFYVYCCITKQNLFLHFDKLKAVDFLRDIAFFSVHPVENVTIHKLYSLLQKLGYHLETKTNEHKGFVSIMPEALVYVMSLMYTQPAPKHLLFIAQNNDLIPAIKHAKSLGILTTCAIAKNQPVSNYYTNQFDYIIDLVDLGYYTDTIGVNKKLV